MLTNRVVQLGHAIVAAIVVIVCAPLWCLPWRAALALGRWYGYAGIVMYPIGRRTAQINLRRFHGPTFSRRQAFRQTVRVFGNMGQAIAEGLQFARRSANGAPGWDERLDIEDPVLHARVVNEPRARVLVTAHFGSWDMTLMAAVARVGAGAAIMRRVDNPFVERLLRWTRRSATSLIDKRGGAAAAAEQLARGVSVAMLLDENAGHKGVWVNFLGRPASTHRTAALLSARTGCPIVVAAAVRRAGGRYLYRLAWVEPGTGPESVPQTTQQITTILDGWIREDPLQWRWVHWRWKSRPDGTQETYTRADVRRHFTMPAARSNPLGDRVQ